MKIKSIRELNNAIEKVDGYGDLEQYEKIIFEKDYHLLEDAIETYKHNQGIVDTCQTCGAHLTEEDDYLVHTGARLSKEKLCARPCKYARQKGKFCLNSETTITPEQEKQLGLHPISDTEFNLISDGL